jgi:hypothetical protein
MVVRFLRSHQWLYDQLMANARPPTTFTWAGQQEDADITIYSLPPWPEPDTQSLRMLRAKDLGRLYLYSQYDDGWFWAPGVFTAASDRCPPEVAGGFYVSHDEFMPEGVGSRIDAARNRPADLLWSFVGELRTAPTLRGALIDLDDPRAETRAATRALTLPSDERTRLEVQYADTLTRSLFVACPNGYCPTSRRLFETMRAGRVPVVISDTWRPPPLVDWDSCSIRVAEHDVNNLPEILREREPDAEELGRRAREIWEQRFSPQGMVHQLVESCMMLDAERPRPTRRLGLALRALPTVGGRRALGRIVKPRIAAAREHLGIRPSIS